MRRRTVKEYRTGEACHCPRHETGGPFSYARFAAYRLRRGEGGKSRRGTVSDERRVIVYIQPG